MNSILTDLSNDIIQVKKGTVIMKEEEIGRCAYFLIKGRLIVEKNIEGDSIAIAEVHPKELVGEFAILDDAPRSATVTAVEDSVLVVLNKNRIRSLIRRTPAVAEVILKLLCQKLRKDHTIHSSSNHLSNPLLWIKIFSVLNLCLKATDYSQSSYKLFIDNLSILLEIPLPSIREILRRLEDLKIIETNDTMLLGIDEEKINMFCNLCIEEYQNTSIQTISNYKEYQIVQMIISQCRDILKKKKFVEISRNRLLQIFLNSPLWKSLSHRYQYQRASTMIQHLINKKMISLNNSNSDNLLLHLDQMVQLESPDVELVSYDTMKSILFSPLFHISK